MTNLKPNAAQIKENLDVTILGAEAVTKSYPNFWEEYQRLGGDVHVL